MMRWRLCLWVCCWFGSASLSLADIFRWDNRALIPGTSSIVVSPNIDLSDWNLESHNLQFADFSGELDLTGAQFNRSWLQSATFSLAQLGDSSFVAADLTSAEFGQAVMTNAIFVRSRLYQANLQQAILSGVNLRSADLTQANITGANLSGAWVDNAVFADLKGAIDPDIRVA